MIIEALFNRDFFLLDLKIFPFSLGEYILISLTIFIELINFYKRMETKDVSKVRGSQPTSTTI
jgi:hypothetical protein